MIVRTSSLGETMVILEVGQNHEKLMPLMQSIEDNFPQITSLYYVVNSKGNETFFDLEVKLFSGSQFIKEKMGSLEFSIGPKSFYQTNSEQAYQLYRLVKDLCEFKGHETLYDLYTGTGTIALFMASSVDKVIGIEQVPEAIEDARRNAANNGIENSHFYSGDIKEVLGEDIINTHGKPNVVISAPPRAGMHQEVIQRLIELSPDRIVYVSCNPATQARDLQLLSEKYRILEVQPVDMFPHTYHVENIVKLEKI